MCPVNAGILTYFIAKQWQEDIIEIDKVKPVILISFQQMLQIVCQSKSGIEYDDKIRRYTKKSALQHIALYLQKDANCNNQYSDRRKYIKGIQDSVDYLSKFIGLPGSSMIGQ
jgi:hypothetical protein